MEPLSILGVWLHGPVHSRFERNASAYRLHMIQRKVKRWAFDVHWLLSFTTSRWDWLCQRIGKVSHMYGWAVFWEANSIGGIIHWLLLAYEENTSEKLCFRSSFRLSTYVLILDISHSKGNWPYQRYGRLSHPSGELCFEGSTSFNMSSSVFRGLSLAIACMWTRVERGGSLFERRFPLIPYAIAVFVSRSKKRLDGPEKWQASTFAQVRWDLRGQLHAASNLLLLGNFCSHCQPVEQDTKRKKPSVWVQSSLYLGDFKCARETTSFHIHTGEMGFKRPAP
jgi:hypothetical protein